MEIKTPLSREDAVALAHEAVTNCFLPADQIGETDAGMRLTDLLLAVDAASRKQAQEPLLEALRQMRVSITRCTTRECIAFLDGAIAAAESKA